MFMSNKQRTRAIINLLSQEATGTITSHADQRSRPIVNDIMHMQGSVPATPEELANAILSTLPS